MTQPSLDRRFTSAVEALQALEQPPQPDTAPLVVRQPPGSKISLTKNADSLEILIPAKGLESDTGLWFLIALLYSSTAVILTFSLGSWFSTEMVPPPSSLSLHIWQKQIILWVIMVSIPSVLGISMPLGTDAFTRVRLRINQQKFFFTYEPCEPGININSVHKSVKGLRQAIAHLEYTQRPSTKGRRGKRKSRLIVWIGGTQTFTIGDYGRITEPELDWLAYELSDWLGMPITRE
jgi:hypothetical protein